MWLHMSISGSMEAMPLPLRSRNARDVTAATPHPECKQASFKPALLVDL